MTEWVGIKKELLFMVSVAMLGCAAEQSAPTSRPQPVTCVIDGHTVAAGVSWPAADGCNLCHCRANGMAPCTKKLCTGTADGAEPRNPGGEPPEAPPPYAEDTPPTDFPPEPPRDGSADPEHPPLDIPDVQCPKGQVFSYSACVSETLPKSRPGTCRVDGVEFRYGESYMASDLCNACGCTEDGPGPCTLVGCPPFKTRPTSNCPASWQWRGDVCAGRKDPRFASPSRARCQVRGQILLPGETWVADDQCNTCRCNDKGKAECTSRKCLFDLLEEGQ